LEKFEVQCWTFDVRRSLSFCGFYAHASEGVGEALEKVVELVTDVSGAEAGVFGDLVVLEAVVVFHFQEASVFIAEFGNEEPEGAGGFEPAEVLLGGGAGAFPLPGVVERGFVASFPEVVEGEVPQAAVEPGAGLLDLGPVLVEAEEAFLHEVLGGFPDPGEAMSEAEERTLLGLENLPECGFFLHGGSDRHDGRPGWVSRDWVDGSPGFHGRKGARSCFVTG
jgi:hypothetical protein